MFTWGPQQASAPSGPAPVADFYALINNPAAAYDVYSGGAPGTLDTLPVDIFGFLGAAPAGAEESFRFASGAVAPHRFESELQTIDGTFNRTFTHEVEGINFTIQGTFGRVLEVPSGSGILGRWSSQWTGDTDWGSKVVELQTNGETIAFSFAQDISAFGIYLVDMMDFGGTCTLKIWRDSVEIFSQDVEPLLLADVEQRSSSLHFFGYVATTVGGLFDRVTFTFTATATDRTGFDNVFIALPQAMPTLYIPVGTTVQFTDASTDATSWLWNLGGGTTSTLQNPTKTFDTPGTFDISLTAFNGALSNTKTRAGYIVVS